MKNKTYKYLSVVMLLLVVLTSCNKDFQKINTDPNGTPNALPEQLLAPALVGVVSANMQRNRSFNNELMQVTVNQSDDDAAIFRYEYRNTVADALYNSLYAQLTNFKDIYRIASQPLTVNKSYQGISLICQAWTYSLLTDTYGDVPYFQSNMARDSNITEPAFDKQKDIYLDIFKQLEAANTLLSSGTAIKASSDPVYNGNVTKWRKFGNSLYLRLLLKLSGKAEVSADMIAKIKDMIDVHASTYPIMAGNDDSAVLRWTGGIYVSPYQTVREQDWRAPAICSFFIDHLVTWADPRININLFATNGFNRWAIAQGPSGFAGVASGYLAGQMATKQSYFYSNTSSVSLQTDQQTGLMMNYQETRFILAECAAKSFISTGTAQTYWETGVLAGLTFWLPTWPNAVASGIPATAPTINSTEFRAYLTGADISWVETESLDQKMERIHLQKYYALFLVDLQQWFEYRRTGHPILPKGPGLRNGGVMPARMTYPVYVQSANPTNYKIAVANQGPDVISTQVWWQKP